MSAIYDNWERLVSSVLRREQDRWLALCDSCSVSSASSDPDPDPRLSSSSSHRSEPDSDPDRPIPKLLMDYTDLRQNHRQWKEMIPPGKPELLWTSAAPLSFCTDKRNGKNCFLLGASPNSGKTAMVKIIGASSQTSRH